jgi:glycosyltransferase involved in cell wall biosynthesis
VPACAHSPAVSVVICTYTERRFALAREAVHSARRQTRRPDDVVLVVDHNPALLARATAAFPDVRVVANEEQQGISGARNTGVRHARGELLAFLDDDARADPDWLEALVGPFDDPGVLGVAGLADPRWEASRPRWLPAEFLWVIGCSYEGLPATPAPVRNAIGASMCFRRQAIVRAGGFPTELGRIGAVPIGCEETEMAIRVHQTSPGGVVLHLPAARVEQWVPAERATWAYFRRRCWAEGLSKAMVSRRVGPRDGLSAERAYVARTLPRGVLRGVRDGLRGDAGGPRRALAIAAGLAITAAGYLRGQLAAAASLTDPARAVA